MPKKFGRSWNGSGSIPQGDIAKLWISLTKTNRIVHSRSFHKTLNVDENFRAKFQRPFDTVIREVVIRFRGRYAAPMQRVRGLAASSDCARAVKTFKGKYLVRCHFSGISINT